MYQYHKWIRSFHAVAKMRSFTAAASYLKIGQPTISEQVGALEDKFSVELFHRRGRHVDLTDAGRRLYEITEGIFGQEDEAIQLLQSLHSKKTGLLRIGAVSPPVVMNLTYELMRKHADIEFAISINSEQETLARLYDFTIDIAILAIMDPDKRLHIVPYRTYPIVAIVRDDHAWASKSPVPLSSIRNEAVIMREPGSKTRDLLESACRNRGIEIKCVMELNSREAIMHAIAEGLGIGFVSEIEYVPIPGTKAVKLKGAPLTIDYYLCALAVRRNRPLIRSVLESAMSPKAAHKK
ncbi:bacterial regulatory helix-turn-helix, lysR family protein [Collimonas arenae]|uniref:Bacterial regulatory helix-turn-helix, lysR family protein n=1 Tax=Collimonas arenae TaxID=279058 RepID=A0A127PKG2_9BURK|nr:LysR substrate-binding domain-containing protein [Collimonas arenae]AMO98215.1 bacterial regulatory helix-turn-helix, lysR family protein [Collimonas arenae]AMP08087.1 bacterial regulatory helix-turn-helix, lysR family protein [Collimonas arenae]